VNVCLYVSFLAYQTETLKKSWNKIKNITNASLGIEKDWEHIPFRRGRSIRPCRWEVNPALPMGGQSGTANWRSIRNCQTGH